MNTNLLLPTAADDLAGALFDAAPGADPRWRALVVRRLAQELRSNPDHAIPVGTVPAFAPPWATAAPVHHLLPAPNLRAEVERVVTALARADAPPRAIAQRNSTLAAACAELPAAFTHERWPALAARAANLNAALDAWTDAERTRRRHAKRLRPPAAVAGVAGRTWRRVTSVAALLEHGRGARWCVTKGDNVAQDYLDRFAEGGLGFWTLHAKDGAVAALLSCDADGAVKEVRTPRNHPATEHRADVLRLVRAGEVTLAWESGDVARLAVDPHLGRRGQPFHEGVLRGRWCLEPIRYRLWSDGRRRRYLLATGTDPRRVPTTWLRLDCSGKTAPEAMLNGAVELAWSGLQSRLMNAALADAFPKAQRPAHVVRAIWSARRG